MSEAKTIFGLVFLLIFLLSGITSIAQFTLKYEVPDFEPWVPSEPPRETWYVPIISEVTGVAGYITNWMSGFFSMMFHPAISAIGWTSVFIFTPLIIAISYMLIRLMRGGG